jgi:hypothetical protein
VRVARSSGNKYDTNGGGERRDDDEDVSTGGDIAEM